MALDSLTASITVRFGTIPPRRRLLIEALLNGHPGMADEIRHVLESGAPDLDDRCAACLRRVCDPGKRTIAVMYHSHLWSSLGDEFPSLLADAGYNALVLTLNPDDDGKEGAYPVDKDLFVHLSMIDVCIGTWLPLWMTWGTGWLADLKTIDIDRIARGFAQVDHPNWRMHTMKFGQYVVRPIDGAAADPPASRELRAPDEIRIPEDLVGPRRTTHVIPLFPGKYERIRARRARLREDEIDRILVCPTKSDIAGYLTTRHGRDIVGGLLKRFPGHTVVFRPRPEERQRPEVQDIVRAFGPGERFMLDDEDDYTDSYARGVVLITDVSGTGQTFTVATCQPSVYFAEHGEHAHISIRALDGVGCLRVGSLADLFDTVAEVVRQPAARRAGIASIVGQAYRGNASFQEQFLLQLQDIVHGRVRGDWLTIALSPDNMIGRSAQDYERSILSVFESRCGYTVCRDFNLVWKYLSLKRASGEPASMDVIERLMTPYLSYYRGVGHTTYAAISPLVRLVLHTMRAGVTAGPIVECLEELTSAILASGNGAAIAQFLDDVAAHRTAVRALMIRGYAGSGAVEKK